MVQRRRDGVKPDMPTAAERQELLAAIGGKPYWQSALSNEGDIFNKCENNGEDKGNIGHHVVGAFAFCYEMPSFCFLAELQWRDEFQIEKVCK